MVVEQVVIPIGPRTFVWTANTRRWRLRETGRFVACPVKPDTEARLVSGLPRRRRR